MLPTTPQQFTRDEKITIISLLLIGLFIVLITYIENPNETTLPTQTNFKTTTTK